MLRSEEPTSVAQPFAGIAEGGARRSIVRLSVPIELVEPTVIGIDCILIVSASLLTGFGYSVAFLDYIPGITPYLGIGVLAFSNFAAILGTKGAYQFHNLANLKRQIYDVLAIWTVVFLILLGVAFSLKIGETLSRGATFGFFILGVSSLLVWRGILAHLLAKALENGTFAERKIIVIGESSRLLSSQVLTELGRYGYKAAGVYTVSQVDCTTAGFSTTLAETIERAIKLARDDTIGDIFLMIPWAHNRCIEGIVDALSVLPVPVHLLPDDDVAHYLKQPVLRVGGLWSAELKRAPLSDLEQALKRTVDIVGAGVGLLVLSPLMILTAVLIKIDSPGPVLFMQTRNGFNGRTFRICKFRTMKVLEDGPTIQQAIRNDPRVTRVGRWIRQGSIDELPQLFNVLSGDMSLVGPRPHPVALDTKYTKMIATYAFRYHVKPGITGWAQINGYRGETQIIDLMAKRVDCDLWYIKNWSLWLDIRIILRTVAGELKFWRSHAY